MDLQKEKIIRYVLKRISFGVRRFDRFRKRILYLAKKREKG